MKSKGNDYKALLYCPSGLLLKKSIFKMVADSEKFAIVFKWQQNLNCGSTVAAIFCNYHPFCTSSPKHIQSQLCIFPVPKQEKMWCFTNKSRDLLGKPSEKILQNYIVAPISYFFNNHLLLIVCLSSPHIKNWKKKKLDVRS